MAQVIDSVLKSYFQTGDIPTEGQYVNFIDSKASIAPGQTNSGSLLMTGSISGTLDVHAKKLVLASGGSINMTDTDGNIDDVAIVNLADLGVNFGDSDIPTTVVGLTAKISSTIFTTTGKTQFGNASNDNASFSGSITAVENITGSGVLTYTSGSLNHINITSKFSSSGETFLNDGRIILGNSGFPQTASISLAETTSTNTGRSLTISAGRSAGGIMQRTGGTLRIQGGQGVGTAEGGDIIFNVSPSGSGGAAINAYSTALTINSSKQSTFNGFVDMTDTHDATDASGDTGALRVEGGVSIAKKIYIGETLNVTGNADLDGDLDVDGTTNLDNTDIDGTLVVDGTNISLDSTSTLNIDNSNTSNGISIGTATSGVPISIGHSTSETTINDNLTVTGDIDANGTLDVATIYNTDLKIGRASGDTTIEFNVDDNIYLKAANTTRLQVTTSGITATGTVIATSHISSSGGGNVYGDKLIGGNMGTISEAFIPMMPTDFNVSTGNGFIQSGNPSAGTNTGGAAVYPSNATIFYVASYMIPQEKTAISCTLYGDGVKAYAFANDIRTSVSAPLFSNGSAGGTTNTFSANVIGDGVTYVTIMLYFSDATQFIDGGQINLQPS